jgi:hypothetical protein
MQTHRRAQFRNRFIVAALFAAICCGLVVLGPKANGQEVPLGEALPELTNGLQDTQFIGPFGVEDEANPSDDVWTFKDGKLSSQTCLEYGFAAAPYWVRRDADGLHFRAELRSPANGTIQIEGVFDGRELRAHALWTKERWYWTIEQTLVFTGRPLGHAE